MVTEILLKSVVALPEIVCWELPLNTTVPVPRLNVPLLTKFPPKLKVVPALKVPPLVKIPAAVSVAGGVSTPEPPTVILLKVGVPVIEAVALNVTVPPLCVNVPLFVNELLKLKFVGAVNAPVPEFVNAPVRLMVVVVNIVPLLVRVPPTVNVEGGVNEPPLATTTLKNVGELVTDDVPPKVVVTVPLLSVPPVVLRLPLTW